MKTLLFCLDNIQLHHFTKGHCQRRGFQLMALCLSVQQGWYFPSSQSQESVYVVWTWGSVITSAACAVRSPSHPWHPFILCEYVTSANTLSRAICTMKHKGNSVLIHFADVTVTSKIKKSVSNDSAHLSKCQIQTSPAFGEYVSKEWASVHPEKISTLFGWNLVLRDIAVNV